MRVFVSLLAICFAIIANAQRKYSDQEIQRLADLGRLWGMLHYFHPKMGTGEIATDSLVLSPAASLIADPSAVNFERCVKDMLGRLKDPATQLQKKSVSTSPLLFTSDPYKPAVHKLQNDIWYFAFPTAAADWDTLFSMPGMMPSQWDSAKAIILDLRNAKKILEGDIMEDGLWAFQYNFSAFVAKLLGGAPLSYVYDRSIYHDGFLSQGNRKFNSSGWKTSTQGGLPVLPSKGKKFQKPLLIIFNMGTVLDLPLANFIQSIKAAGLCKIVFEGSKAEYPVGKMIKVDLADSLSVNLRVSDFMIDDNQLVPVPDWRVDLVSDTSLSGTFVKRCVELLSENKSDLPSVNPTELSMRFVPPVPGRYESEQLPSPEKRLLAVYNWWNAINYFFPYKHLIGRDWDNVLTEYIPRLVNANDTLAYNLELMGMISEIADSHGYVASFSGATPFFRKAYGYWPPMQVLFIEDKLLVVNKADDSLQDMNKIHVWDEITDIDGKEIDELKKDWKRFFQPSNESTFLSSLPNIILKGTLNSKVKLGLLRNGRKLSVTVTRTGKHWFDYKWIYFQDKHAAYEELQKGIVYVKMGSLQPRHVDSVLNAFNKSKAIIFDLRDNIFSSIVPFTSKIACHETQAVMYERPYVTAGYIKGGEFDSSSTVSYYTIKPSAGGNCYKGKVVVLVNEMTQSAGEFTAMLLDAASDRTTIIGSQTAGADGGITQVVFPGGYFGQFTGTGIKYPDGKQTQRIGIKVDIEVKPTIAGFKAGNDEVLEGAVDFIKKGK